MSLFPPVPPGIVITPFSEFIPAGYARAVDEHGNDIEVDAYAGLPTVRIATEEEVLQRRKDRKKRRHAGQCTDATGRLVPWWEEWERGEHERTTSVCGCVHSCIRALVETERASAAPCALPIACTRPATTLESDGHGRRSHSAYDLFGTTYVLSHHTRPGSRAIPVPHLHRSVVFDARVSQAQSKGTRIGPSRHRLCQRRIR